MSKPSIYCLSIILLIAFLLSINNILSAQDYDPSYTNQDMKVESTVDFTSEGDFDLIDHYEDKDTFFSQLKKNIIKTLEDIFSPRLTVFLLSMMPIFELRGSIPVGLHYFRLDLPTVYFISIIGNMIPIFFILLFFDVVTKLFNKVPLLKRLLDYLFERTRKRTKLIEKYEELALIFFVAIPLPITGAWTGSLAAYLLGLKFWKSILCIFIGVLIASVIVTTLSLLGVWGGIIALTVLTIFFVYKFTMIAKDRKANKRKDTYSNIEIQE